MFKLQVYFFIIFVIAAQRVMVVLGIQCNKKFEVTIIIIIIH